MEQVATAAPIICELQKFHSPHIIYIYVCVYICHRCFIQTAFFSSSPTFLPHFNMKKSGSIAASVVVAAAAAESASPSSSTIFCNLKVQVPRQVSLGQRFIDFPLRKIPKFQFVLRKFLAFLLLFLRCEKFEHAGGEGRRESVVLGG